MASLAILGMALLVAAAGLRAHVMPGRGLSAPVELQAAVGPVGPGSQLTLQTAAGPMKLTVDSQMNQAGYVHAYGYANGQMYAGFVQLAAQNAAAQQALVNASVLGPFWSPQRNGTVLGSVRENIATEIERALREQHRHRR